MKSVRTSPVLDVCMEGAAGLLDIFRIGATALQDRTPEADTRNLNADLQQIGDDFRRVMSEIGAGRFDE